MKNATNISLKINFIFISLLLFYLPSFAQEGNITKPETPVRADRSGTMEAALNTVEHFLRQMKIELAFEYAFAERGEQSFDVINSAGSRISKLTYPFEGEVGIIKGEVEFLPRVSLGGRYGSSNFRKKTNTDEDWNYWDWHNAVWTYITYQKSIQDCKTNVEFSDINLYYRFIDYDRQAAGEEEQPSEDDDEIFESFRLDQFILRMFIGYQSHKGRYKMVDPTDEIYRIVGGSEWVAVGYPASIGLNSPYKIFYQGPQLGFQIEGVKDKISTRISLAFSLLNTKAYGWWNLRTYDFEQNGEGGMGINAELELNYKFNSHFSVGTGYHYLSYRQKKLKESGNVGGSSPYDELDIIRNADYKRYGPSLILKYIW